MTPELVAERLLTQYETPQFEQTVLELRPHLTLDVVKHLKARVDEEKLKNAHFARLILMLIFLLCVLIPLGWMSALATASPSTAPSSPSPADIFCKGCLQTNTTTNAPTVPFTETSKSLAAPCLTISIAMAFGIKLNSAYRGSRPMFADPTTTRLEYVTLRGTYSGRVRSITDYGVRLPLTKACFWVSFSV